MNGRTETERTIENKKGGFFNSNLIVKKERKNEIKDDWKKKGKQNKQKSKRKKEPKK